MGRRSAPAPTTTIAFRVSPEQAMLLDEAAKAAGISTSEFVRGVLFAAIEKDAAATVRNPAALYLRFIEINEAALNLCGILTQAITAAREIPAFELAKRAGR